MDLLRQPSNTRPSKPDYGELASLEEFCGEDCSPEQVSAIYRDAEKLVEDTPVWFPFEVSMSTSTAIYPRRTPDPAPSFKMQVRCAIAEVPVEAGYCHPAEAIREKAVTKQPLKVIQWFRELLTEDKNHSLVGDILTCFAHAVAKKPPAWAHQIAENALRHPSVAVRDAAAQALELWGTSVALRILRKHDEEVRWLRKYIEEVIELLESG